MGAVISRAPRSAPELMISMHAVIRAAPVIFLDVAIEDAARWCDGRRGRWHDGRGDLQGAAIGAGADDLHACRDQSRAGDLPGRRDRGRRAVV